MLAKVADALPTEHGFLFEPKWDGFRALVFRGNEQTYLQSRDLRPPLNRYFPELEKALHEALPKGCVLDGEIVFATPHGLDFDALQMRLHPAAPRVAKLAKETPASFVAFDLLGAGGKSTMELAQSERCARLERLIGKAKPPLHLTPLTCDRAEAEGWLEKFEGAGLDGVIAKLESLPYQPGKQAMLKIKHVRSADCVVAGFRWYKAREDQLGSLLLGLYDEAGVLQHVGVTSAFTVDAPAAAAGAASPAHERAAGPSLARLGQRCGRRGPVHAQRANPPEQRQGPGLGARAARTRVRGQVRPPAGQALPPRRGVPALAARQAGAGVHLRAARVDPGSKPG